MTAEHDPADRAPFLLPQPPEGEALTAPELVNRYGTYEIPPTADSRQFFPAIAQGEYNGEQLHRLRLQSTLGTRGFAREDPSSPRSE